MDNLTHSMAGWALGQAGLKTKTRKGLAALILGANMPDIDVFFGNAPWDPLAIHRGFTHGLVGGVLVMPPLLAGLLWLLDRWQLRHDKPFKSGLKMHVPWLIALCYLGAVTHPLLDLLTTYSVQLWSPFSGRWYHADGLFIIDIWVWLVLGGAIGLSKWRERTGREWRRLPQAAILVTLAYIGANLLITQRAYAAVREWAGDRPVDGMFASPPPAYSWRRDLVWREGGCYRRSHYDPFDGGFGTVGACEPTNMSDPLIRAAVRYDPGLRKFLKWSVLPQAEVTRKRCRAHIAIGDARYGEGRNSRLGHETDLPLPGPGC
ncbi:metal-dependent hydrolase [Sphingomonas lutea]|uniref:Metal-dependent hydrolase n=1 Tax=Sphingomonas lutea TaxID=1045317 RepID=A0A7G9SK83_9SPHN|nr:metal-dependent hydrolase [Sphingomonas lutea]QNN68258.1 metal-dependent hydrolase [Sphingomonas lutea]